MEARLPLQVLLDWRTFTLLKDEDNMRMPSQQDLAKAFAMFDRNGDGLLSLDWLKAIFCYPTPGRAPLREVQV